MLPPIHLRGAKEALLSGGLTTSEPGLEGPNPTAELGFTDSTSRSKGEEPPKATASAYASAPLGPKSAFLDLCPRS